MTRFYTIFSISILAACVPVGLAGPACSKKHYKTTDCIQRCKSKWGWPGRVMGTDPWGSVVQNLNEPPDFAVSKACGFQPQAPSKPVGNAQDGPPTTSIASPTTPLVISTSKEPTPLASIIKPSTSTSAFISPSAPIPVSFHASVSDTLNKPTITKTPFSQPGTLRVTPALPTITRSPGQTTTNAGLSSSTTTISNSESSLSPTPSSVVGSNSGDTSGNDIQAYLAGHNTVRAHHGAMDLTWNDNLAKKAQQWANGCQFKHSGGSLGAFGENLAAGTGSTYSISTAIKSWTDEVGQYNPSSPQASHFTQVVWKATTQVGCAVQSCDGIFDPQFGKAKYYVCEYSPAGNVEGQFTENVQL